MKVTFLGGAGTVTGSKYLVESGRTRVLVDCGLFQGLKSLRLRNWRPLPVDPRSIDAVVLTHAHIDHSGYLPVLVRDGFRGPIYCTGPTAELCNILLPDSGHLQEEDARYANKKKFSKHRPARPLYTEKDAKRVGKRLTPIEYGDHETIGPFRVRLVSAGHILGAASAYVGDGGGTALFSGDLGRPHDFLMQPPTTPEKPDWIFMESTYGSRSHADHDPLAELGDIVSRTIARRGVVVIPSFAVGRAQTILYCLYRLFEEGTVKRVPVYLNSPMATDVTDLYRRHTEFHRLSHEQCATVCRTAHLVGTAEESKRLNLKRGPMVIISASGMLTGGRVLHHLRAFAPSARNTILLPGYQAPGTRGAALVEGAKQIKIHGNYVPVKAEVVQIDGFSAHADQGELLDWLGAAKRKPRQVYLVHGDPSAADRLRQLIEERMGWPVTVPELGETTELTIRKKAARPKRRAAHR
jgi:metallo-beta-lactamase family protein